MLEVKKILKKVARGLNLFLMLMITLYATQGIIIDFGDLQLYLFEERPQSEPVEPELPMVTISNQNGRVLEENDNYKILWELDITGHLPHDNGTYVVEGVELMSKQIDRTLDVAIVSPAKFKAGSKAYWWKPTTEYYTRNKSYHCSAPFPNYGWIVNGESFFCNQTVTFENATGYQWDEWIYNEYTIPEDHHVDMSDHPNSITVYWNNTYNRSFVDKVDVTDIFSYKNINTIHGDNVYYVDDVTFKANYPYKLRFELKVNESDVPFKYAVCFGDYQTDTLYFCLDPTVYGSRTWTTNADFTNGTVSYNLSTSNDDIRISKSSIGSPEIFFRLDESSVDAGLTNNGATYNSSCTKTIDGKSGCWEFHRGESDYMVSTNSTLGDACKSGESLTVALWFYGLASNTVNVVSARKTGVGDNWQTIWSRASANDGALHAWLSTAQKQANSADNENQPGEWQWLAYVFNDDANTGKVYINNAEVSSYSTQDTFSNGLDSDNVPIYIGNSGYGSNYGNGQFKWVSIWCEVLSTDDLTWLSANNPVSQTSGTYEDGQQWCPDSGNTLKNMTTELTTTGSQTIQFFYNKTQASLNSSAGTTLSTNGTNTVSFPDLTTNDCIYYKYTLSDSGSDTPRITSYTLYEESAAAPGNNAPNVTLNNPTNNTAFDLSNPHILNVTYNDGDAEAGTVTFYNNSDNTALCTNSSVSDGSEVLCALTLARDMEVKWYVNSSDGTDETQSGLMNFTINPLGTLSVNWNTPTSAYNHTQYEFDTYTATVSCSGGECGIVNFTIDPVINVSNDRISSGVLIHSNHNNWDSIHDNTTAPLMYQNFTSGVQSDFIGGDYTLRRVFYSFDTSHLNDSTINSVKLWFNISSRTGNSKVSLFHGNRSDFTTLLKTDFGSCSAINNPFHISDNYTISAMPVSDWFYLNMTSDGFFTINDTGYTSLCWRTENDFNDSAPTNTNNLIFQQPLAHNKMILEINFTETVAGGTKSGAISTVQGTTPFYTSNTSNPVSCGSMGDGDSCQVSFLVNATGSLDSVHEFYWIADSDLQAQVDGSIINVTIVETSAADTCTYSSGQWDMDCSDNCAISSEVDLSGNNLHITGTGSVSIQADILNCGEVLIRGTDATNRCEVTVQNAKLCD